MAAAVSPTRLLVEELAQSKPGQQSLNSAASLPPVDSAQRQQNRFLSTDKVLALLHTVNPDLFKLAEVVGKWVWVAFTEPPAATHRQQLSQLGFHWNRERQAWQHPCGAFRLHGACDPHQKYASYYPADEQAA